MNLLRLVMHIELKPDEPELLGRIYIKSKNIWPLCLVLYKDMGVCILVFCVQDSRRQKPRPQVCKGLSRLSFKDTKRQDFY